MFREALLFSLKRHAAKMQALLLDIPESHLADSGQGGINHPAWIMGHVLLVEHEIIEVVLGDKAPWTIDETWRKVYDLGTHPESITQKYKPKSVCMPLLEQSSAAICEIVAAMPEFLLMEENPHPIFRTYSPRKIDSVMAVSAHRAYHSGQIATWRKCMSMPHIGA